MAVGCCSKIYLLLWKNFLLRKRRYCATCCELAVAPLLVMLVFITIAVLNAYSYSEEALKKSAYEGTIRTYFNAEDELVNYANELHERIIAFVPLCPGNTLCDIVMRRIKAFLDKEFSGQAQNPIKIRGLQGFPDEASLESVAANVSARSGISLAVVFGTAFLDPVQGSLPANQNFSYKIRISDDKSKTEKIYPTSSQDFAFGEGVKEGLFMAFQVLVDTTIIQWAKVGSNPTNGIETDKWYNDELLFYGTVRQKQQKKIAQTNILSYAPPRLKLGTLGSYLLKVVQYFVSFGYMFMVPLIMLEVVAEKRSGIKELMRMVGLSNWMHLMAWLISFMITCLISSLIITVFLFLPFKGNALVPHGSPILGWIFLYSYCLASIAFILFIASFFDQVALAVTVGLVSWLLTLLAVGEVVYNLYDLINPIVILSLCLIPNVSWVVMIILIQTYEEYDDGIQFSNINKSLYIQPNDKLLTPAKVLAVTLASIFMYLLLAVYFENIVPHAHGRRRNCCFCLLPSDYWSASDRNPKKTREPDRRNKSPNRGSQHSRGNPHDRDRRSSRDRDNVHKKDSRHTTNTRRSSRDRDNHDRRSDEDSGSKDYHYSQDDRDRNRDRDQKHSEDDEAREVREVHAGDKNFEREPKGLDPGVVIKRISKHFGNRHAVDDVSLNVYKGQITVLLGHNGAGKTTLLGMLSGVHTPSSGTALVNGFDISKDLVAARSHIGLCPQENLVFETLTVRQNLMFFAKLKNAENSAEEIEDIAHVLRFSEKLDQPANTLSGGQKRKLNLGMALIGGSDVVILDEPTSGMDPESRRGVWESLLKVRSGRCIILTTHMMEEADILGDRIAIMSQGKLRCCGSSAFLKHRYGSGYIIRVAIKKDAQPNAILAEVKKYVKGATMERR